MFETRICQSEIKEKTYEQQDAVSLRDRRNPHRHRLHFRTVGAVVIDPSYICLAAAAASVVILSCLCVYEAANLWALKTMVDRRAEPRSGTDSLITKMLSGEFGK